MSSTPATTARTTRGATVGRALIVVGGVLAALSSWLNWGADSPLGKARSAYTIPAKFVIDNGAEPGSGGLSLGIVVLVLGLLVVLAAFVPGWKVVGLLVGLAVGVVAILYAYQVRKLIHDARPTSGIAGKSFRDLISIGPYIAGIGGALAVIGGVIGLIPSGFWSSLTSEEDEGKPADKPEEKPADTGGTPS
jgi:hypothetical protein